MLLIASLLIFFWFDLDHLFLVIPPNLRGYIIYVYMKACICLIFVSFFGQEETQMCVIFLVRVIYVNLIRAVLKLLGLLLCRFLLIFTPRVTKSLKRKQGSTVWGGTWFYTYIQYKPCFFKEYTVYIYLYCFETHDSLVTSLVCFIVPAHSNYVEQVSNLDTNGNKA